eukprot:g26968.t1
MRYRGQDECGLQDTMRRLHKQADNQRPASTDTSQHRNDTTRCREAARGTAQEEQTVTPMVRKRRQPSRKTRVVTFSSDEGSDSGEGDE